MIEAGGFHAFRPCSFPSSLAGVPGPAPWGWAGERGGSLALACVLGGNSHLFLVTRHPAKMPVDLAFFLLFRCGNFQ